MKRRLVVVALTVCVLLAASVTPALAHALLLRSIPDANAALDRAPAQVELFFSEALDPSFSKITVLGSTGTAVDVGDSRVDPADATHMTVSLPSLPDGVYTVSWKALSSTDGHVTTGTFPFAVGNVDAATLAAAAQASRQVKVSFGQVAATWLSYLAAAMLAGGTLFVLVVWEPAQQALAAESGVLAAGNGTSATTPPWERLAEVALALFALASIVALLVEAGQVAGAEVAAPWNSAVGGVIFQTRYGAFWLARLALILALGVLLLPEATKKVGRRPAAAGETGDRPAAAGETGDRPVSTNKTGERADATTIRRKRWIAFGVGVLLLLVISLASHAAAEPDPVLPTLADWLHLSAAAAWIGGLTFFTTGLWFIRRDRDSEGRPLASRLTVRLLPRFSLVALVSVDILAITGLYMAVLRLGSWDLLFSTLYGKTLIVKVLLAAPMVGMGAVNLLWTTPAMKRAAGALSDAPVVTFFRRFVTTEVTLGITVLLTVGLLTNLPPARTTATASSVSQKATVDDLNMVVTIEPGRVGLNTFTLQVTSNGQPVVGAKQVALRFTPKIANLAPSQAVLTDMGNGTYSARGAYFSLPDDWQVQAVVRRDGKFDAFANFDFPLGATAQAAAFPWNRVTGLLVLIAAVLLFFVLRRMALMPQRLGGVGAWAPAVALCAVGLVVYYQAPPSLGSGPVNPIPPNSDSVAAGHTLFVANCVPCHGLTGKGDGPVGLTLNPRPADLTLHAVPGVHTDGQLYTWISNGFAGSVMPAFKSVLSDNDRWNLVNYVRTLAQYAPTK